jgi:hypothetical protein
MLEYESRILPPGFWVSARVYGWSSANYKRVVIHMGSAAIQEQKSEVDQGSVTELDIQGGPSRRSRIAYVLAASGAVLAIAGVLLGILYAILARAWSGEIACNGVRFSILNLLPGTAAVALGLGLLFGIGAMVLHSTQRRAAASAISLSLAGSVVAFLVIAPFALTSCS